MQLRPHQREACDAMLKHNRGQIIVPTGGGKTMCMIRDAIDTIDRLDISTIVVVAPRILLAEQLCSEFLEHIDIEDVELSLIHISEPTRRS